MRTTPILDDETMRKLGFTDYTGKKWFFQRVIDPSSQFQTALTFTIDKNTGVFDDLVEALDFGQPEYYNSARPSYANFMRAEIDSIITELNSHGLTLNINHLDYGDPESWLKNRLETLDSFKGALKNQIKKIQAELDQLEADKQAAIREWQEHGPS